MKIHLRDYVLLSHRILAFFDGARNLKLISFFTDKLKGKKETSCDEYLTDYARKYFEVIFFVIDHAFYESAYSLCNCLLYWNPSHFSISEYWNANRAYICYPFDKKMNVCLF